MDMHGVLTKPKSEAIEVPDDSKANEACMHRRLGILYTALTKVSRTRDTYSTAAPILSFLARVMGLGYTHF